MFTLEALTWIRNEVREDWGHNWQDSIPGLGASLAGSSSGKEATVRMPVAFIKEKAAQNPQS